jgi:hypothetical protein
MGDGRWAMGDGRWETDGGRLARGSADQRFEAVRRSISIF